MERFLFIVFVLLSYTLVIGQVQFDEVASRVGIDHRVENNGVGGGVSFVDFDDDGDDDITLATEFGIPIAIYRNDDGQFVRLDPPVNNIDNLKQIIWVDFDNDGDKDLYVNAFPGINRLYENKGAAGFEDITSEAELSLDTDRSYGAIWADFNRDGWLDLYTQERRFQTSGLLNMNRLYFNDADRTFTEVTLSSGADDAGRIPFCAGALDYNNDNWPDIYIANDRKARNTLLRNNKDGTFTDVSVETGAGIEMDGMSVTVGDYDLDGDQDIYVTNIEEGNVLLRNDGVLEGNDEVTFTNVAEEAGVILNRLSWGANFFDSDNDADLDLYASGSLAGRTIMSSAYFRNNGDATFSRRTNVGMTEDTVISYNNAIGDFNNDGLSDIIVFNNPPYRAQLWENQTTNSGNWIKLRLQGVLSSKDAVGSKIEIYTNGQYQQRYIHCGHGFIAQNSFVENIGIGSAIAVDSIIVTWPTGHQDKFLDLVGSRTHLLVEGASTGGEIEVDDDVEVIITSAKDQPLIDSERIRVYPNPTSGMLQFVTDLTIDRVEVYNYLGQLVLSHNDDLFSDFNMNVPKTGIYYLVIYSPDGIVTKRIMVQR